MKHFIMLKISQNKKHIRASSLAFIWKDHVHLGNKGGACPRCIKHNPRFSGNQSYFFIFRAYIFLCKCSLDTVINLVVWCVTQKTLKFWAQNCWPRNVLPARLVVIYISKRNQKAPVEASLYFYHQTIIQL